jgi:hypothetical protein
LRPDGRRWLSATIADPAQTFPSPQPDGYANIIGTIGKTMAAIKMSRKFDGSTVLKPIRGEG